MLRLFWIGIVLVVFSACTDSKVRTRECEELYAETGDAQYHGQTDCRAAAAARLQEVKKTSIEIARRHREKTDEKQMNPAKPVESDEIKDRLYAVFSGKICKDLRQSDSTAPMQLSMFTYKDNEPLYSLHAVYPSGSADMQTSFYTLKGERFCVDGGISGGDCIHRLSDRTQSGAVNTSGTIPELKALLKCR
jgi:hypothetical protein